jgi:hypothetical protein
MDFPPLYKETNRRFGRAQAQFTFISLYGPNEQYKIDIELVPQLAGGNTYTR